MSKFFYVVYKLFYLVYKNKNIVPCMPDHPKFYIYIKMAIFDVKVSPNRDLCVDLN